MAEPSLQPQPFYSSWAQRDSWALKSTGCSSRGSGFHFQHAYGAWQPYVTSFLRDLLLPFGFCGHQTCTGYIGIHKGKFFFFSCFFCSVCVKCLFLRWFAHLSWCLVSHYIEVLADSPLSSVQISDWDKNIYKTYSCWGGASPQQSMSPGNKKCVRN